MDADDFGSQGSLTGTAEQRLVRMLTQVVERLPADVESAYQAVYARVEETYGRDAVRGVLTYLGIALSGLRETDLRAVVPGFEAATFASIRRALRAHLGERGAGGEWAFSHSYGRKAALERCCAEPTARCRHHRTLAEHLQTLTAGDPRRDAIMHHLLEAGAVDLIGHFWRTCDDPAGCSKAIRRFLLSAEEPEAAVRLVLQAAVYIAGDDPDRFHEVNVYSTAEILLKFLEETQLDRESPDIAERLLGGLAEMMDRAPDFGDRSPEANAPPRRKPLALVHRVRSRAWSNLAVLHWRRDELDAAIALFEQAAEVDEQLAAGFLAKYESAKKTKNPSMRVAEVNYNLSESDRRTALLRLALVYTERKDYRKARSARESAQTIALSFLERYPKSGLALRDLVSGYNALGDSSFDEGQFRQAVDAYSKGLELVGEYRATLETMSVDGQAVSDDWEGVWSTLHVDTGSYRLSVTSFGDLAAYGQLLLGKAEAKLLELHDSVEHLMMAIKYFRVSVAARAEDVDRKLHLIGLLHLVVEVLALAHEPKLAVQFCVEIMQVSTLMLRMNQAQRKVLQEVEWCTERWALLAEVIGDDAAAGSLRARAKEVSTW